VLGFFCVVCIFVFLLVQLMPEKTYLQNDLLFIEWDVKVYLLSSQ